MSIECFNNAGNLTSIFISKSIITEISIILCFMGAKVIHSDDNNEKNWGKIKTASPFYSDAVLSEH